MSQTGNKVFTLYINSANRNDTERPYDFTVFFDNEEIIYSDNNYKITLSELESNLPNDDNIWWSIYNVAKMVNNKELFIRMRMIAKNIWKQRKNNNKILSV